MKTHMTPEEFENVLGKMQALVGKGLVKGHFEGPKQNVLICDTAADWCVATGELVRSGLDVVSPGGYGGSNPVARQTTHYRLWESGEICGVQYTEKKKPITFLFGIFQEEIQPYLDIVTTRP